MAAESNPRLLWAIVVAGATALAVYLIADPLGGAAAALVGGVAALLVAVSGHREIAPAPPAPPPDLIASASVGAMLDAVAEPLLLVQSGRVVRANRAARALLGDHIVGEDARVAVRHPAAATALASDRDQAVELVGIGGQDARWQMRLAAADDGMRVVHLSDRSENAATERMRVDFVANASHELRTPLASILGYVETLDDEAGDDPAIRHRFLRIMMDEARRMQRLVEDLLSLSRIEAERYRLPDQPVALGELVDEVCGELKRSGAPRAADVACFAVSGLPDIVGDRAQLSQMLHNLVGNAMKYGRPGTPVEVRLEPDAAGGARLSVMDQGDGIAPEHLPRLTERFYRVDAGRSRSLGGTGLGLAIVKHVVERHRGRLDISSRVGVGTTMAVTLPAAPAAVSSPRNNGVTEGRA